MALTKTTTTAAVKASDLTIAVASTAVGFPAVGVIVNTPAQMVMIDEEIMFLVQVLGPGLIQVRNRGSDGGLADTHDTGSSVVTSAAISDFPASAPTQSTIRAQFAPDIDSYGASGAITVPTQDTKVVLTAGSALAMTLAAPSLAANGTELVVTSQSAFAHVVTATSLYDTGAAGSPFTTATFTAQPGASMWLVAQNGLWNVVNSANVTFS